MLKVKRVYCAECLCKDRYDPFKVIADSCLIFVGSSADTQKSNLCYCERQDACGSMS